MRLKSSFLKQIFKISGWISSHCLPAGEESLQKVSADTCRAAVPPAVPPQRGL